MELFIGLFLLLVVLVMSIVLFRGGQEEGGFEDTAEDQLEETQI